MSLTATLETLRATSDNAVKFRYLKTPLIILGVGKLATDLCQVLTSKRLTLIEVVGLVDANPSRVGEDICNSKIVGTYEELFEIVGKYGVQVIAVCLEDRRMILPMQSLLDLKAKGLNIVDGHQLYEQQSGRLSIDLLRPSVLIFSRGFRRRRYVMWVKRLLDLTFSIAGFLFFFPLFLVVAMLIKLDSTGPVFYRQVRVGLRSQPYMIWKFRSMRSDAEKNGPRWAEVGDSRISRVGRWLRKLHIDEFPQLINIFKGEMSLVGPRPERPVFVQELRTKIPYYDIRHTLRPGLTGWAQINYQYGASTEDSYVKLQYDLFYVKNMNLALDLRIIIKTVRVVLLGEGAR